MQQQQNTYLQPPVVPTHGALPHVLPTYLPRPCQKAQILSPQVGAVSPAVMVPNQPVAAIPHLAGPMARLGNSITPTVLQAVPTNKHAPAAVVGKVPLQQSLEIDIAAVHTSPMMQPKDNNLRPIPVVANQVTQVADNQQSRVKASTAPQIEYNDIELKTQIGSGAFGNVWKGTDVAVVIFLLLVKLE